MPTPLDPTPSATDEAVPAAANPPGSSGLFQSIEILRRSHTALLRGQRKESGTKAPTVAEIVEFMHRARATGRIIAAPESRDAIQGIVDYWYGILMLGDWKLVGEIGSLNLEEYDLSTSASASIKPAQPESEAELQARDLTRLRAKMRAFDERWAKGSRGLLRRLLLRLFTLSEVTNQARLSQLPKADELLKDSATTDLVRELVDAGLLQTEASAAGPNLAYVLSDERLLKEWEPLREAVKERRSLREMATGWERSGKSVDALLEQGRVLELAKDYVDLIGPEGPFLTESRTASIEKGQRRSRVKSAVIAVLVLSVVVAVWQWREAEVQSELAETRRIEAENSAKNASLEAQKARAAEKEAKEERAKVEEQTKATMALADEKQNLVEDSAKQKVLAAEEKKEAAEKLAEKTLKAQLEAVDRLNQIAMGNRNAVEQLKAITPLLRAEDRSKLEGALSALGFSLTAAESGEETAQKLVEQTSVASPAVAVVAKAEVAPRLVKVLEGHNRPITAVTFASDGKLATASEGTEVRVWNGAGGVLKVVPGSTEKGVNCVAFSPDGKSLIFGSDGKTVRLYDFSDDTMRTYSGHRGSVTSVAFSSDGTLALSSSADKSVQIWDPKELTKARFLFKPKPLHTLPADSIITSAAFDLGAKRVVASLDANKALLWTISGKWAPITLPMNGPVKRAVFSRDGGKALAVDSGGCSVAVWEASTGKRLWQNQHNAPVFQAIFDHEGKLVASTSADQTVKIWRSDGGTAVATLAGHQGEVRHVAAHPTKNIWLTGSSDTTAKLWFEGETKARHTLLGHSRRITSVAFNKDGTQFATGSYDGTVRLYDLKPDSGSQIDSESTGWSLYGWLDTTSKDRPRLRAQSFNPKSGDRTTIPMVGLEAEAEAIMNIRREVKRGDSGRWDQGEATGVLREKESVKVLEVLWDKEMKLQPQAVWIRFKRL